MDLPSSLAVQFAMGSNNSTSENPALYHLNALFPTKPAVVYAWITYVPYTTTLSCYINTNSEQPAVPSMQANIVLDDYVPLISGVASIGFFAGSNSNPSTQLTILNWRFQAGSTAFSQLFNPTVLPELSSFDINPFTSDSVRLLQGAEISNSQLLLYSTSSAFSPVPVNLTTEWITSFSFTLDFGTSTGFGFAVCLLFMFLSSS